jgi:hypothetical protein
VKNSLCKGLRTCRKTDYKMNEFSPTSNAVVMCVRSDLLQFRICTFYKSLIRSYKFISREKLVSKGHKPDLIGAVMVQGSCTSYKSNGCTTKLIFLFL